MSAQPKQQPVSEPITEKSDERDAWADEQKKHDYYYDDSHGYEVYDPGKDDQDKDRIEHVEV